MSELIQCPSCARHIRARESQCPFCAAAVRAKVPATFVVAAAIGAVVSGCDIVCRTVRVPGVCPAPRSANIDTPRDDMRIAVPAYGIAPPPPETLTDSGIATTPAIEPTPQINRPPNRYGLPRWNRGDRPR